MNSLWIFLGLLVLLGGGGIRRLLRARSGRQPFLIDDEAVWRIERDGFLPADDPPTDEPLDETEISQAEDEFWRGESWENPEEH